MVYDIGTRNATRKNKRKKGQGDGGYHTDEIVVLKAQESDNNT